MDSARVVVLDDDPTGSQAAACVRVLPRPDAGAAGQWLRGRERSLYVVTNIRALPCDRAVALLREFCTGLSALARPLGQPVTYVLRGDSTLRGHVLAELDCLGARDTVSLLVPAFPEGGRITIGGTHYLVDAGTRIPVSQTEFARRRAGRPAGGRAVPRRSRRTGDRADPVGRPGHAGRRRGSHAAADRSGGQARPAGVSMRGQGRNQLGRGGHRVIRRGAGRGDRPAGAGSVAVAAGRGGRRDRLGRGARQHGRRRHAAAVGRSGYRVAGP
jgi:hypothetical protein